MPRGFVTKVKKCGRKPSLNPGYIARIVRRCQVRRVEKISERCLLERYYDTDLGVSVMRVTLIQRDQTGLPEVAGGPIPGTMEAKDAA